MMGMLHDFILYGDINGNYVKIGQNVPVRTAQFIVSEVLKLLNNWESIEKQKRTNFYRQHKIKERDYDLFHSLFYLVI